jgi:hypothetical protein
VNAFSPAASVCRAAAGVCDTAETCSGTNPACPTDAVKPSTEVCRLSVDPCDAEETCDGAGAACPADGGLSDGDEDGVCDVQDVCPAEPDPGQVDADGDDAGDACDPCNNFLPVVIARPQISVSKLFTGPGDDRLKASGSITVPLTPAIDPIARGVRIVITDSSGDAVVDAIIPGGYDPFTRVGWTANGSGTTFSYRNSGRYEPVIEGITKVKLKMSPSSPGLVRFSVSGKDGSYALTGSDLPLTLSFSVDPPYAATNQCGEASFPGPSPGCVYASGAVKCR